ncbi:MAG: acetyl-CoA carboxylase biotin carboxyl carrier protein [Peptococcaceae bacterium]|jgi:acetyl-CoA carboxylase biotin carboxyl carrier protein|nr:acetyl-CoA carboxylase biotin carboxyl carrier protein [Peptococcaceae bacterium]
MNSLQDAKNFALEMLTQAQGTGVSSFEFEYEGLKIKGSYSGMIASSGAPAQFVMETPVQPKAAASAMQQEVAQEVAPAPVVSANVTDVKAPLVGTFYAAPSPDAAPYVSVGQKVQKGDVLCIVEAMKNMNEIECPCDGTVVDILASNGELVEFNQVLIQIEA